MKSISVKLGVIFTAFVMAGCATQTVVPVTPKITTKSGKTCARTCRSTYSQCNMACSQMKAGATTTRQQEQCLNNCNQALKDCYLSCE